MRWAYVETPIGELAYAADESTVYSVQFGVSPELAGKFGVPMGKGRVAEELKAYFRGELTEFTVQVSPKRGNEFERAVWEQMKLIPYGETRSYGYIAKAVGEPGAGQAVGTACNRNPIPVIVPCHRIIGADGKLVGFGGGLERKRILLELEAGVKMRLDWS